MKKPKFLVKLNKLNGLDKYVIFSISVALIYTICEFVVSTVTGVSHETLTTCVYAFFTGEVAVSGLIKIFKLRENGEHLEFYKDE